MMDVTADVAIVGGSFAGLACAQAAAARGLRTIVLERKADPGQTPHTTGLLVKEVAAFSNPLLRAARTVFFHTRGLFTAAAWRDLAEAWL
ncbi:MAG: FAD-dependent oxidoreductase [Planctomycetota bacterium]|nr:FAD-dependent oxidoreductase [Planctomycetota bacterium]